MAAALISVHGRRSAGPPTRRARLPHGHADGARPAPSRARRRARWWPASVGLAGSLGIGGGTRPGGGAWSGRGCGARARPSPPLPFRSPSRVSTSGYSTAIRSAPSPRRRSRRARARRRGRACPRTDATRWLLSTLAQLSRSSRACRAERGEQDQPARAEHARELGEHQVRIAAPVEQEIAGDQLDAAAGDRQADGGGAHVVLAHANQRRVRSAGGSASRGVVDAHDGAPGGSAGERPGGLAGGGTDVEHGSRGMRGGSRCSSRRVAKLAGQGCSSSYRAGDAPRTNGAPWCGVLRRGRRWDRDRSSRRVIGAMLSSSQRAALK